MNGHVPSNTLSDVHIVQVDNTKKLNQIINHNKPWKQQIWRDSPDQLGWTSSRQTPGCKLASRSRNPPGNLERRQRIFSHFSPCSFFGSTSPAPSALSLHQWLLGSHHCQAGYPGWPRFLRTDEKKFLTCNLGFWTKISSDFLVGCNIFRSARTS